MSDLDYILECIVSELELERELGARVVEIDRSLLEVSAAAPAAADPAPSPAPVKRPMIQPRPPALSAASSATLAFLADGAPSKNASLMLEKIVSALEGDSASMPVVGDGDVPAAEAYVVLGARALARWFPSVAAIPGDRFKDPSGRTVLVTYSPEKILRYAVVTKAVVQMKKSMWQNIKALCAEARRGK